MVNLDYSNVILHLVQYIPEFTSVYQAHLDYTGGEILPHILFGELVTFTRKILDTKFKNEDSFDDPDDVFNRIMLFIECAACSSDRQVVELITVSFLENLSKPILIGPYYDMCRIRLGPISRHLLEEVDRFWTNPNKPNTL